MTISVGDPAETMPGRNGGKLRRGGRKGHKGGSGRTPHWLRQRADDLLANARVWERIERILTQEQYRTVLHGEEVLVFADEKAFLDVVKWLADRSHGKAKETIDLNADIAATIHHEPLQIMLPKLDRHPAEPREPWQG